MDNDFKEKFLESNRGHFILERSIFAYRAYVLNNNIYSGSTLDYAINELHRFDRFLKLKYGDLDAVDKIKQEHIKEYLMFCKEELLLKDSTINSKLRYIKFLFDFIDEHLRIIEYNPAYKVHFFKIDRNNDVEYMPKKSLKDFLYFMENRIYGVRDVVISKFLAYTGLKINEVFDLQVTDLDFNNNTFVVKRNGENHTFGIPQDLLESLEKYLELRNLKLLHFPTDNLFLSKTGKKYSYRSYSYAFKDTVEKTGFSKDFSPKHLRFTFAVNMSKVTSKDKLKRILNQNIVDHFYIDEIKENPLLD